MAGLQAFIAEPLDEGEVKACCSSVYENAAVRWLLGDRLHPGGETLTLRLAELAGLTPSHRVLDVASGAGDSALLMTKTIGCSVTGLEHGLEAVNRANQRAEAEGMGKSAQFIVGDAETLPFPDGTFDAVMCECSLCTFPDKSKALSEMARVIRPGGTAAIADVTANVPELEPPLRGAAARVACIADALLLTGYEDLLTSTGFELLVTESHGEELASMVDRIEARLKLVRMAGSPELEAIRDEIDGALELATLARRAITDGRLGYFLLVARRSYCSRGRSTARRRASKGLK